MANIAHKESQDYKPQVLAPCFGPCAWRLLVVHLNMHFLINNKVSNIHIIQHSYYRYLH